VLCTVVSCRVSNKLCLK